MKIKKGSSYLCIKDFENVLGDNTELPEEVQANVQEAADSCPTSAIETE